ncbi:MAG TPA: DMT family transporter [Usitatibacteraceae bacterium]|nr:DMT family transporter [Usitatibacteraceae bacterium]
MSQAPTPSATTQSWLAIAPTLFVLLWSTGFVGMRLGIPYAEPFTFMALRMGLVVTLLLAASWLAGARWPASPGEAGHAAVAGLLVHATYLSGVLFAIQWGLPLGYVALIAGLQPILTALLARFALGERLGARQKTGMALGLAGVAMVVLSQQRSAAATTAWPAFAAAGVALLGITLGTLYQKRFCSHLDIRTGGVIQFAATGAVLTALSLAFESQTVHWTGQFVFALLWLSLVLSIGAISLLYLMIRHGAASAVVSLFFLTPAVTAVMAYALFDEFLPPLAVGGLLVSAIGVALVLRNRS